MFSLTSLLERYCALSAEARDSLEAYHIKCVQEKGSDFDLVQVVPILFSPCGHLNSSTVHLNVCCFVYIPLQCIAGKRIGWLLRANGSKLIWVSAATACELVFS